VAPCEIEFDAPEAIQFAADRAILVGLIINELVSNAGKHAYPDRPSGTIWVRVLLQSDKQTILISVRDEGVGFPAGYDSTTCRRLGTRLVNALSKQLGGELTLPTSSLGTNFTLRPKQPFTTFSGGLVLPAIRIVIPRTPVIGARINIDRLSDGRTGNSIACGAHALGINCIISRLQ
jgi:hypothetical protein